LLRGERADAECAAACSAEVGEGARSLSVSHTDPQPAEGHGEDLQQGPQNDQAATPQELYTQAVGQFLTIIALWFFDFGSWAFAA